MENAILIDLAKRNNVRNVKNFHKLAEIWEEVTSSFNTSTGLTQSSFFSTIIEHFFKKYIFQVEITQRNNFKRDSQILVNSSEGKKND
jgi:hypothetical protein